MIAYDKSSIDQPGEVADPAHCQLNVESKHYPVPVRAWEFSLAKNVLPSRPAPSYLSSTLRLNVVLTHRWILPAFRSGVYFLAPVQ